jgi:O-6-methylguanine DNA methyltransferase
VLSADPLLSRLVEQMPGLRVPGAFDGFEIAVRAVLGQQVTVAGATTLAGRLARALGEPIETPFPELQLLAPTPRSILDGGVERIASLGLPRLRAQTLVALARAVADEALDLSRSAAAPETIARLRQISGIGPWTAHYIAMRALGWPDAFPGSDLGLRKATGGLGPAQVEARSERWRPWRAYAAMHLWASLAKEPLWNAKEGAEDMNTDREFSTTLDSPLGRLIIAADETGLLAVSMRDEERQPVELPAPRGAPQVLLDARRQLEEYFEGKRTTFSVPIGARGTEFQRRVWKALTDIPFGETESYGALAARIGSPGAARAVGAANGRNPVAIVVPCHRVIGADGTLTGYAGGEGRKRWLLEHERRLKGAPIGN